MIRHFHAFRLADGTTGRHEGVIETCPERCCQWPQLGIMVTVRSDGRNVTGTLDRKSGQQAGVRTHDGCTHEAPLVTARRPEWGAYCPHGTKLVEAVPAEHTCEGRIGPSSDGCRGCWPDGRKILPWPCGKDGCTEADFDREEQAQMDAYHEEMRQSYYG